MQLLEFLQQQRESILAKWFDSIIATYPPGSAEFLGKQKDRFRNPVGHATRSGIGVIYDEIVTSMNVDKIDGALDDIVRIRAVQDFTAAKAVDFVFHLKPLVHDACRDHLGSALYDQDHSGQMSELESRIDRVALIAFDKYMQCRDQLFRVRTNEIRKRSERLMKRLGVDSFESSGDAEPGDDRTD